MVITLDKHKKPLGTCTEKRARILLSRRRACVYRYYPFTIIIKDKDVRDLENLPEYKIKIDPGSKYTGIAIVRDDDSVVLYSQIEHRGDQIRKNLETRRMIRRNRRSRETRYRKCKFKDGGNFDSDRKEGWLPPSIKSNADNIISIVRKYKKLLNITSCSFEAVRFDTQLLDNPDIEGKQYQHGTLFGYEIKEYLLDKYGHVCQYCGGVSGDSILEWEHIHPVSKGGSDSVKNATLACHCCNSDKSNKLLDEWLEEETLISKNKSVSKKRKDLAAARINGIQKVMEHKVTGVSNRYCAWVNSTRKNVENRLFDMFDNVECASGGRTKYNREQLKLPKDHHCDALYVGTVPKDGYRDLTHGYCLYIKAIGRGTRFRGKINKCGIITLKLKKVPKTINDFRTGDIVSADIEKGKFAGYHVGRVTTRQSGYFDIRTTKGEAVTTSYKNCTLLQRNGGYRYAYRAA